MAHEHELPPEVALISRIPLIGSMARMADNLTNRALNSEPSGVPLVPLEGMADKVTGIFAGPDSSSESLSPDAPALKETAEVSSQIAPAVEMPAMNPNMALALAQFRGEVPMQTREQEPVFGQAALPTPGHTPAYIQQASLSISSR